MDESGEELFALWHPPFFGPMEEYVYTIDGRDVNNIDGVSYKVYGNEQLWWVLLWYNKINDPYNLKVGQKLKIPDIRKVLSILEAGRNVGSRQIAIPSYASYTVPRIKPVVIQPYQPIGEVAPTVSTDSFLFNFGFPVPEGLTGTVHFQIQASSDALFSEVVMSKMTQTSVTRWYYYSPSANNGGGGYVAFPSSGIDGNLAENQTVYFQVRESDNFVIDTEYYFRYRAWVDDLEGEWYVSPPMIVG